MIFNQIAPTASTPHHILGIYCDGNGGSYDSSTGTFTKTYGTGAKFGVHTDLPAGTRIKILTPGRTSASVIIVDSSGNATLPINLKEGTYLFIVSYPNLNLGDITFTEHVIVNVKVTGAA